MCNSSFLSFGVIKLLQHKIQNAVLFSVLLPESFTPQVFTLTCPACLFGGHMHGSLLKKITPLFNFIYRRNEYILLLVLILTYC